MKATVANFDIGRLNGNSYLLRGKGDWVRAFLSDEYVAYNNSELAQTAAVNAVSISFAVSMSTY